jgi:hypothetical protein
MIRLSGLSLPLDHAPDALPAAICARLGVAPEALLDHSVFKRGNDARKRKAILLVYTVDVELADEAEVLSRLAGDKDVRPTPDMTYRFPTRAPEGWHINSNALRPVVIGAGPCGLFAGLILAQMGFRPIILERGKVVRERTKDTWGLWRRAVLNPDSNVQFGEGGAGTFSDGKLYCRVKDPRFLGRKVLEEFVKAGAPDDILWEAHPHIGTFRLVTMVESIRRTIEELGGEYRWQTRVDDIALDRMGDGKQRLRGLHLHDGSFLEADHVVLAVGHSARPTFEMLHAAACISRPSPSPSACGSSIRRAGSIGRAMAVVRATRIWARRPTACAPLRQWPHGLQLLHVPRRARGRRDIGGRARRHQRHEPVFARRIQRQFRPRRRYRSGAGLSRWATRGHRVPAPLGIAGLHGGRRDVCRAGADGGRFPRRARFDRAGRSHPFLQTRRHDDRLVPLPARFAIEAFREALPVFGRQIAAMTTPTR